MLQRACGHVGGGPGWVARARGPPRLGKRVRGLPVSGLGGGACARSGGMGGRLRCVLAGGEPMDEALAAPVVRRGRGRPRGRSRGGARGRVGESDRLLRSHWRMLNEEDSEGEDNKPPPPPAAVEAALAAGAGDPAAAGTALAAGGGDLAAAGAALAAGAGDPVAAGVGDLAAAGAALVGGPADPAAAGAALRQQEVLDIHTRDSTN